MSNAILAAARVLQIVNIFVAGNGAASERTVSDRFQQQRFPAGFDPRFDKITHN